MRRAPQPAIRAIIEPVPASTPAGTGVHRTRALPHDLLEEASNRLGVMALTTAVLWGAGTILYRLSAETLYDPLHPPGADFLAAANVLVSIALFFYSRRGADRAPHFILDLGLVYLLLTATSLGVVLHWDPVPAGAHIMPSLSWIGVLVVMFSAIVPTSPRKMALAALIAVSMNPAGMLIARERNSWDFGPTSNILLMHYPDYLLIGVAAVISRVVTRLGQHVSKAREMGSYRLVDQLGKGGMGEVWRARHQMLARDAAIKLIQPGMLSNDAGHAHLMRRRFEQEAKATASLRSPHTVELYDFGVTAEGVFYYVMELLDGIDLDTLVRRHGPQSSARVVHILTQVCRSLEDAHRHGMIHRDIKPGNIFLCRMGTDLDFVKVLDFGLVKVSGGNEAMTVEGTTTGTPAYLAPEIAMGRTDIDGRTDLYGLGCVAYWLLTGRLVFEENGATPMILAHVSKAPHPPSERTEIDVPEALDRAILMCLAKEPALRPQSAEALTRMLDACGGGSWTRDDAERWWQVNMRGGGDRAPEPHGESLTLSG